MVQLASAVAWGFRPAFGGRLATGDAALEPTAAPPASPRRDGSVLGRTTRVRSTREGRLVLVLRTDDGEIELHGTPWARFLDGEGALPPGDLWDYVGSEVLIAWAWDGRLRVIASIAIQ